MTAMITSTESLRAFLLGEMQGIAEGKVELERAKGISNLSQQVYNTLLIEVKMAAAKSKLGDDVEIKPVEF